MEVHKWSYLQKDLSGTKQLQTAHEAGEEVMSKQTGLKCAKLIAAGLQKMDLNNSVKKKIQSLVAEL